MKLVLRLLALAMVVGSLESCAMSGLDFFEDDRLSILSPEDSEEVDLPVTVQWRTRDFDGLVAVFVDDVAPMRPGDDLASLVGSRDACHRDDTCGDTSWLAEQGIYVTDRSSVTIDHLSDRSGARSDTDPHEVTLVLLDRSGTRLSEATFRREFIIERRG